MNILLLLTPKKELAYLDDGMSVRQALEKMHAHSYTQIPVISKNNGEYVGTITEGDILWFIAKENEYNLRTLQRTNITSLIRKDFHPSIKVDADISEVVSVITKQNFIPVVDDRNILMGIVTRAKVIEFLKNGLHNFGQE